MAFPTVAASQVTSPGGTGSSITPTLSSHQVGDVLAIFVGNTGNVTYTAPASWTIKQQSSVGTTANGVVGTLLYHVVVSGDSLPLASPTINLGATVTRHAICDTWRGSDVEAVFTSVSWGRIGVATGTANPIRPPSVTTMSPENLIVHYYVQKSATNNPDPSGYTPDQEALTSGTVAINSSFKTVAAQQTVLSNQDVSPTSGVRWVGLIVCIPSKDYAYFRSGAQATVASGTSVTPTKPTGTTNSDVNGNKDVMIATVEGSGSTTLSAQDGALWTEIPTWTTTTSGGGSSVKKFWCYATATPNMQFNRTGTGEISACVTTYYNCNQTNPIGNVNVQQNASSTTSAFPALTRSKTKVVISGTCVADAVPTFTSPASFDERMDGFGISCIDQIFDGGGQVASASFTLSAASPTACGLVEIIGISSQDAITFTYLQLEKINRGVNRGSNIGIA